jgi:hypothetical protein
MAITDPNSIDKLRYYLGYPITEANRAMIRTQAFAVADVFGSDTTRIETILRQLDSLTVEIMPTVEQRQRARELIQELSSSISVAIYRDIFPSTGQIIRG